MSSIFTIEKTGCIKCVLPNGQVGYGGDEKKAQFNAVFFPVELIAPNKCLQSDASPVGSADKRYWFRLAPLKRAVGRTAQQKEWVNMASKWEKCPVCKTNNDMEAQSACPHCGIKIIDGKYAAPQKDAADECKSLRSSFESWYEFCPKCGDPVSAHR